MMSALQVQHYGAMGLTRAHWLAGQVQKHLAGAVARATMVGAACRGVLPFAVELAVVPRVVEVAVERQAHIDLFTVETQTETVRRNLLDERCEHLRADLVPAERGQQRQDRLGDTLYGGKRLGDLRFDLEEAGPDRDKHNHRASDDVGRTGFRHPQPRANTIRICATTTPTGATARPATAIFVNQVGNWSSATWLTASGARARPTIGPVLVVFCTETGRLLGGRSLGQGEGLRLQRTSVEG